MDEHGIKVDIPSAVSTGSNSPPSAESIPGPITPEDVPVNKLVNTAKSINLEDDATTHASDFKLGSMSIDEDRPFRVVVIGAGFSGIIAGIRFPQRMNNLDLTIYEKNAGIGGTWYENRYPGAACDYPSHCYQLSFEEKTDWSAFYSPGPEIRADMERVVEKYKLMRYIKLQHELIHAQYDEQNGKWHLKLRRPASIDEEFEVVDDVADLVLLCVGSLSRLKLPNIDGIKSFKGKIMHSANWDRNYSSWQESVADWKDKRVGVIGSGSTAIQTVAALQPHVGQLYNYVREKLWLSPSFLSDKVLELLGRDSTSSNYVFTDEDKERLKDPEFFRRFRYELEVGLNSMHYLTIRGSKMQEESRKAFKEHVMSRLHKKPWIADHLSPDFSIGCRRLTPGPGYLEALQEDNVDFVTTPISRITERGIDLADGTSHDLDVIVCATGFDTSYLYPFEVIGRGGKTLRERYTPHPETYLSLCTDGFPNWFMTFGPNSVVGAGSFLPMLETQVEYAIKVAKKLQREHLKCIEPKPEAIAEFDEYLEAYLKTTVFSENCRSWYKMGTRDGRITGAWPGSSLHHIKTITEPRWEDYNYEQLGESKNRFYCLGDGSTHNEKYMVGDRAWYLRPEEVDIPPAHTFKIISSVEKQDMMINGTSSYPKPAVNYESTDGSGNAKETKTPKADFKLGNRSMDEDRPFKVVVIGTGYAGIIAGIRFPQRMSNLDLTIYDRNAGIGGTWYTNKYPGVACDYPSHCYQLPFEEKTDWSAFYSPGSEILGDLKRIVEKYDLMRYIKLQHELIQAKYDEQTGKWHLKLRRPVLESGEYEVVDDTADLVLLGVGSLSRWTWPDIDGLRCFKGKLMHSAEWDSKKGASWEESVSNWKNKKVGVIGGGSAAIQIVPALQPHVGQLFNFVRGPVWLSPSFLIEKTVELLDHDSADSNYIFSDVDKEKMKDPVFYKHFRHELEAGLNSMHYLTIKGSEYQENARRAFSQHMMSRLQKKPWIAEYLKPDFAVACRRLVPGPGYLEAVQEDNVEFVPTKISRITETGVDLEDRAHLDLDVIVCATGYDLTYLYPFEVIGRGGKTLREHFTPHPETYLSICTNGFPNWFSTFGPNSVFGAGSFLPVLEAQVEYIIKAAKKLQREHLKSIEPKAEAVADFDEYLEAYFKTTVFNEHCRSWYKMGKAEGRITGLWPGSSLHEFKTYQDPRWEDFNYEQHSESKNRFYWLGDGSTYNEKHMTGDRAWYLNPDVVDIPPGSYSH
ncbi:FAD/NAD-binding domain-containing protein [Fomitiporia mediterranea MF3/22]|uniref:FAD/NAD-binding domain-containing protein n=1 Tax=Fomitiporia mediterranea (strain MF3/22) TaxID=694068 RepID=UPI0004409C4E|nr:FAD/NAD-binding domain-containing protein [Fomitiporia mediterranea MF3/22]EJC99858.1 FAD/NAD-binding domain-containing protein [Fomitiporia mediterranea MF3/22]